MDNTLQFSKLEGVGNDYIVIDGRGINRDWNSLAVSMSRYHFGIGSDGLLVVEDSNIAQVKMRVFNPDGSEAEMSGNGIRIFAKFVVDNRIVSTSRSNPHITVETAGGIKIVESFLKDGLVASARVEMGKPNFSAQSVGLNIPSTKQVPIQLTSNILDKELTLYCVSLGNPHAVTFTDTDIKSFPLAKVGSSVQSDSRFINSTNFEVFKVLSSHSIRVRIFERGAGETLSSGTGSTAAATIAVKLGLCKPPVEVHLDGGKLKVDFNAEGVAFLEGPVNLVFTGTWQKY